MSIHSSDTDNSVYGVNKKFTATMDKAGVPEDFFWRSFLSHLYCMKNYPQLTGVQKEQIQEFLLRTLSEKDFSEVKLSYAFGEFLGIINSGYERKLQATMQESMALIEDMKNIMGRHAIDVDDAGSKTEAIVLSGGEPATVIAKVRDVFKEVVSKMEQDACSLETMILHDGLTSIANRRGFDLFLQDAMSQWENDNTPVALIMVDVDNFKQFNDKHGHRIGDQALKVVAQHTKRIADKYSDAYTKVMPARYGGEEFSVIIVGRKARDVAAIAEDLRSTIARFSFIIRDPDGNVLESSIRITVSLGAAKPWTGWSGAYCDNLVDSADKALYFAKRGGKNRVAMYTPDQETQYTIFDPGA